MFINSSPVIPTFKKANRLIKQLAFFIFVYSTTFPQHPDRIHPGKPHFSYVELTLFSVFSLTLRHKTIMFIRK